MRSRNIFNNTNSLFVTKYTNYLHFFIVFFFVLSALGVLENVNWKSLAENREYEKQEKNSSFFWYEKVNDKTVKEKERKQNGTNAFGTGD